MSNTKDTPARQPSFYRSPSNDYEEGYRDAKKEMDALKLELQKQKELNAELVKCLKLARTDLIGLGMDAGHNHVHKITSAIKRSDNSESLIKKSNEI